MKKVFALALAALLLQASCALALVGQSYPAYDALLERGAFCGRIDGAAIRLGFTPLRTIDDQGRLLLNFAAYDSEGDSLDLTLTLPAEVRTGDVFSSDGTPGAADGYGVSLLEETARGEDEYFAGFDSTGSYTLTVVSAVAEASGTRLRLDLDATLSGGAQGAVSIEGGLIDITLRDPDGGDGGAAPDAPAPTGTGYYRI